MRPYEYGKDIKFTAELLEQSVIKAVDLPFKIIYTYKPTASPDNRKD